MFYFFLFRNEKAPALDAGLLTAALTALQEQRSDLDT